MPTNEWKAIKTKEEARKRIAAAKAKLEHERAVKREMRADRGVAVGRLGQTPDGFFAFSHEDIDGFKPLNTADGQATIDALIARIGNLDLVVFDSVMCLTTGDMKDEQSWQDTMPWARTLTGRDIGQLWIHHTGHDETRSYGTKTREWQMDTRRHRNRRNHVETAWEPERNHVETVAPHPAEPPKPSLYRDGSGSVPGWFRASRHAGALKAPGVVPDQRFDLSASARSWRIASGRDGGSSCRSTHRSISASCSSGRRTRMPACSVLVPVENLQRSVDLLVAASQKVAARSYVVADFHELRAAH